MSSPVSTTSRESAAPNSASELRPRRHPAGHLAVPRRRHDDADRALQRAGQLAERRADRLLEVVDLSLLRGVAGRAHRVGQVGVQTDPLGVRGREVVDLRAVAVVGREVEVVTRLVAQRLLAGPGRLGRHRPRRLGRVADDRPGGHAAAPADHPPLHRREVLRLVDEHVRERVVLDPVGRRGPAARAGVLAVGGGPELLQRGVLERRGTRRRPIRCSRSAGRRAGSAARRAGRCRRRRAGRPTTSRAAGPTRRRARPRPRGPAARGRAASRARSRRRAPATSAAANSRNSSLVRISSAKSSLVRSRARSPVTWRHIASISVEATLVVDRLRRPIESSWRRSGAELARAEVRSRRRGRRRGTRAGRRARPGATYDAAPRPSRASPSPRRPRARRAGSRARRRRPRRASAARPRSRRARAAPARCSA